MCQKNDLLAIPNNTADFSREQRLIFINDLGVGAKSLLDLQIDIGRLHLICRCGTRAAPLPRRHLASLWARWRDLAPPWGKLAPRWRELAPPPPPAGQACPMVARGRATSASCWASLPHGGARSRHLCLNLGKLAPWWREVAPPPPQPGQACPMVARGRATSALGWASLHTPSRSATDAAADQM